MHDDSFRTKLIEAGWERELLRDETIDWWQHPHKQRLRKHKLVRQPKDLTDRSEQTREFRPTFIIDLELISVAECERPYIRVLAANTR